MKQLSGGWSAVGFFFFFYTGGTFTSSATALFCGSCHERSWATSFAWTSVICIFFTSSSCPVTVYVRADASPKHLRGCKVDGSVSTTTTSLQRLWTIMANLNYSNKVICCWKSCCERSLDAVASVGPVCNVPFWVNEAETTYTPVLNLKSNRVKSWRRWWLNQKYRQEDCFQLHQRFKKKNSTKSKVKKNKKNWYVWYFKYTWNVGHKQATVWSLMQSSIRLSLLSVDSSVSRRASRLSEAKQLLIWRQKPPYQRLFLQKKKKKDFWCHSSANRRINEALRVASQISKACGRRSKQPEILVQALTVRFEPRRPADLITLVFKFVVWPLAHHSERRSSRSSAAARSQPLARPTGKSFMTLKTHLWWHWRSAWMTDRITDINETGAI